MEKPVKMNDLEYPHFWKPTNEFELWTFVTVCLYLDLFWDFSTLRLYDSPIIFRRSWILDVAQDSSRNGQFRNPWIVGWAPLSRARAHTHTHIQVGYFYRWFIYIYIHTCVREYCEFIHQYIYILYTILMYINRMYTSQFSFSEFLCWLFSSPY